MESAIDSDDQPAREVLDARRRRSSRHRAARHGRGASARRDLVKRGVPPIEERGEDALTGEPTGFIELDRADLRLQPAS
jgi:hypothetical protein